MKNGKAERPSDLMANGRDIRRSRSSHFTDLVNQVTEQGVISVQ